MQMINDRVHGKVNCRPIRESRSERNRLDVKEDDYHHQQKHINKIKTVKKINSATFANV